ncbi:MAG: RNA polymerase sigma factor [Bacteroidetes bacterium]|jgi:RNA polymerase sigma factor (sigma-70 family)|nr:RNA polymerase sigma factor [Bacteroidota bacterium]MBT4400273.1 RNA polymerase sigma factor [Bacteroidota bacterium]MBT4411879.1 RNA polymerase sigma factor [Bacteroidota bacterium]MBT5426369.1 RNA polymerase sigma factor [Bacteroidota bacterium]MBT7095301.1 RNA polymerase sigma factor [Bacteroidota bacterium]
MNDKKDFEVINSVLKGKQEEFGELISRYQDKAYRLSLGIVHDPVLAEEAVHLSFIKAYESLSKFKRGAKFSTWFYRIVYNVSISQYRYEKKFSRNIEPGDVMDLNPEEINDGINFLKTAEQQQYLALALEKLSPSESTLIRSYYLEDLDIDELIEITGLSRSNIKVKLFRARKKIYQELENLLKDEVLSLIEQA